MHDWWKADTFTMIISNRLLKSESAFAFLTFFCGPSFSSVMFLFTNDPSGMSDIVSVSY